MVTNYLLPRSNKMYVRCEHTSAEEEEETAIVLLECSPNELNPPPLFAISIFFPITFCNIRKYVEKIPKYKSKKVRISKKYYYYFSFINQLFMNYSWLTPFFFFYFWYDIYFLLQYSNTPGETDWNVMNNWWHAVWVWGCIP